jgi:fructoselysine-6-P-deglycase FrlB-like protein
VNPDLFRADLEEKPARLSALAASLRAADPWAGVDPTGGWVFVGMGSSHYASQIAAARLRSRGVPAVAVTVRYPHDDVDDVRLLAETLVLELVAAEAWRAQPRA